MLSFPNIGLPRRIHPLIIYSARDGVQISFGSGLGTWAWKIAIYTPSGRLNPSHVLLLATT